MSETASTGAEGAENTTGTEATETTSTAEVTTVEQLPQFAQDLIRQLRQENAQARVKKNEAAEVAKAKTKEEFEALLAESNTAHQATQAQLSELTLKLAKLNAAVEAGVPTDKLLAVASRLNGTTDEEIKADVAVVKQLFGIGEPPPRVPATDPSQGKGGSNATETDEATSFFLGLLNNK